MNITPIMSRGLEACCLAIDTLPTEQQHAHIHAIWSPTKYDQEALSNAETKPTMALWPSSFDYCPIQNRSTASRRRLNRFTSLREDVSVSRERLEIEAVIHCAKDIVYTSNGQNDVRPTHGHLARSAHHLRPLCSTRPTSVCLIDRASDLSVQLRPILTADLRYIEYCHCVAITVTASPN